MAKYKCECGETKEASGVSIKIGDNGAYHDIKCECGKYMDVANPKTGVPSFRSNRYGQIM